jgi:pyrimidine deaminase RibD-like protein
MFTTGKGSEQETKTYVTSNQEGVKDEDLLRYNSIIDVLLAAGYFRVRIATLSPFDKVIGGTCWCISNSNVDVDVDVSFQEDANIGQKMFVQPFNN